MTPEDCKAKDRVLAQRLILAPDSQQHSATSSDNGTRHGKEQHRRANLRDVRRRPLEDDPTRVRWFVLAGLKEPQRGCRNEHGRG